MWMYRAASGVLRVSAVHLVRMRIRDGTSCPPHVMDTTDEQYHISRLNKVLCAHVFGGFFLFLFF